MFLMGTDFLLSADLEGNALN